MPAARQRRDQLVAQAVRAQRGDRELEARLLHHVHEVADPRVVGDARADETDARRLLGHLGDGLAQRVHAAMAHGAIDLALEAEAAAAAAALADLHERHVPVFRVRRLHERDRLERVHVPEPPLRDDRRQPGRGRHLRHGAVVRVPDVIGGRDVHAFERRRLREELLAVGRRAIGIDQLVDQLLALADRDQVHERRHRLRVGEGADPAHEDDRVVGTPEGGAARDPRLVQEAHHVDVVALVGDREPDEVEVRQRTPGLERQRHGPGPRALRQVLVVRDEHALAHDVGALVQVPVDRLEAEVRHPDGVGVGVDQGHGDLAAPVLADGALFVVEEGLFFLLLGPGHPVQDITRTFSLRGAGPSRLSTAAAARRLVHASPARATATPSTLASCATRNGPSQKLSSRTDSMRKRPTE